jgi:hypothetical protein
MEARRQRRYLCPVAAESRLLFARGADVPLVCRLQTPQLPPCFAQCLQ